MSRRFIIGFVITGILIILVMTYYVLDNRIPMNESDTGNLAGNMQNGGLFFEMDNKVYFANPSDSFCLYSMDLDESNLKQLSSMNVKYITGANNMLYFYMDSTKNSGNVSGLGSVSNQYGIYRCRTNGKKQTCLLRDFCGELQLCGEYLYYQLKTDQTLNKMRVDKTNKSVVSDEMISPVCYDNQTIYFTGVTDDHGLHALHTNANDYITDVLSGYCFFPVVNSGYIYYLDGAQNYTLWRTSLLTSETENVTSDRVDCFTMNSQYIFYSTSTDQGALKRCDLDGSNQYILYQGITNSLNLTSRYLYFKAYGSDDLIYHIPLDFSQGASLFMP